MKKKDEQITKFTKQARDVFSNQKIAKIFMSLVMSNKKDLVWIPFYFYDEKEDQAIVLWCNGINSYSIELTSLKNEQHQFDNFDNLSPSHRGIILENFLKIEFLTNVLLVAAVGSYSLNGNPGLAMDTFIKIGSRKRIQLLKQYKLLTIPQIKIYNRLNDFRNLIAHQYSLSDIKYSDLSDGSGYSLDIKKITESLRNSYLNYQPEVIDYVTKILTK